MGEPTGALHEEEWTPPDVEDQLRTRIAGSFVDEFVLGHSPGDILRELVQNEFDAGGQAMTVVFGETALSIQGTGKPVTKDGWPRLAVIAGVRLTPAAEIASLKLEGALTGLEVAVFGKYWGRELSIPKPKVEEGDDTGGFYIDFVLARLDTSGNMAEFTAVEVQTIDTTGSYKAQSEAFFAGANFNPAGANSQGWSKKAGLNWANVSKRILPQLIYKGYVLRRERLCGKGLFFICPTAVLKRVRARLGTKMLEYPIAAGTITFQAYDLSEQAYDQTGMPVAGQRRTLIKGETFTTTVEQVAFAFVSPVNLPEMGVYENAIATALKKKPKKKKAA